MNEPTSQTPPQEPPVDSSDETSNIALDKEEASRGEPSPKNEASVALRDDDDDAASQRSLLASESRAPAHTLVLDIISNIDPIDPHRTPLTAAPRRRRLLSSRVKKQTTIESVVTRGGGATT